MNLMKEYANDFLGDFNVHVVGSNATKGQIALTFLASEGEALAANVHAQRDKFVYRRHTLSTMAVDTLEIAAFKFPEAPPVHAAPASASGVHAAAAPAQPPVPVPRVPSGPSPLFSSPNRRLVQTVFESTPPGLPAAPMLPGDVSSDDKLDKVLTSLDSLTTFIRTEVVTRTHLDRFHQEQIQAIENRVEQAVEPLTTEIKVLKERVVALEAHHIGSGARVRSASERPRATDPAFKTIVFKGIPEIMAAEARLSEIEAFVKMHFPQVRVRDVGNFYKGPFPNGRSLTRAAYVEFSNADVRREVIDKIGGSKDVPAKIKCILGGVEVRVKKAMTEQAIQRNAALRRAADVIKADARFVNAKIDIEWVKERGVTVNGSFVFSQGKSDLEGKFVAPYADLTLPSR